jgi:hypothetical protein
VPVEVPVETLRRMACTAEVIVPIIVAADGTALYLGRDARVANRAQRRVLRAMYRGCAIPGCEGGSLIAPSTTCAGTATSE